LTLANGAICHLRSRCDEARGRAHRDARQDSARGTGAWF
jgi:hypothetical protein